MEPHFPPFVSGDTSNKENMAEEHLCDFQGWGKVSRTNTPAFLASAETLSRHMVILVLQDPKAVSLNFEIVCYTAIDNRYSHSQDWD